MTLEILSAGAAKGVVNALRPSFRAETGSDIEGSFGAVGAMREKLFSGVPCDVIILTAKMIAELGESGHVHPETAAPLGLVRTGVAVRTGDPLPDVSDANGLRASVLAAGGIYIPDPERATAGIHIANVLKDLGIYEDIEPRLRAFPNGAAAMQALARAQEPNPIGSTQVTEIKYSEGVTLVGLLPAEYELATVYSVAVSTKARNPDLACRFADLVSGAGSRDIRAAGGFEV